jgi:hypothetical protein
MPLFHRNQVLHNAERKVSFTPQWVAMATGCCESSQRFEWNEERKKTDRRTHSKLSYKSSTGPFKNSQAYDFIHYIYFLLQKIYTSSISSDVGITIQTHISRNMETERYKRFLIPERNKIRQISGSHGGEYEDGCLLGCCASSPWWWRQ